MRIRRMQDAKIRGQSITAVAMKVRVCVREWVHVRSSGALAHLRVCQYIFTTRRASRNSYARSGDLQHLFSELPTAAAAACYNIITLYCTSFIYIYIYVYINIHENIYIYMYKYCVCMRVCTQRVRLRFSRHSVPPPPDPFQRHRFSLPPPPPPIPLRPRSDGVDDFFVLTIYSSPTDRNTATAMWKNTIIIFSLDNESRFHEYVFVVIVVDTE